MSDDGGTPGRATTRAEAYARCVGLTAMAASVVASAAFWVLVTYQGLLSVIAWDMLLVMLVGIVTGSVVWAYASPD